MRKAMKRIVPTVLSLSLAVAPLSVYAETLSIGPSRPYDEATMIRLQDNVLEYEEIGRLVETYNPTLKKLRDQYEDQKDSMADLDDVKDQIYDGSEGLYEASSMLYNMASQFENLVGVAVPGLSGTAYVDALYSSAVLEQQSEQMLLTVDSLTEISPEMMRIQMLDSTKAALTSGAQSAVIGYEQIQLQKSSLKETIALLEAVYQSTERQVQAGMSTQTALVEAQKNLDTTRAGLQALESQEIKIRQSICTMLGWNYWDIPEVPAIPAVDPARIEAMNPEADKAEAIKNNFTVQYNRLSGNHMSSTYSIEYKNLQRTLQAEEAEIASSMVNLYNQVIQARSDLQTAQKALALSQSQMTTADRKMELGMIGKLEYLQQKNAYETAKVNARTAELTLLQAVETYDWAKKGNLTLTQ